MDNSFKLILGAMNFGPQVDFDECTEMVRLFQSKGYKEIDSAYVYNGGETELMLGELFKKEEFYNTSIATKVHPRITGKLDGEAVNFQFKESLNRMNRKYIDILYFHFPDAKTPIIDALKAINHLHEEGSIKEFGLSNFPAWMVVKIWHICNQNKWIHPTVYQGRYNGLSRNVEPELFPALRDLNMRFYAYNPLAGGMLTGKYLYYEEAPVDGRFARLESYRKRYWKKSYFDAVNLLTEICKKFSIMPVEAAYRWLAFHSFLEGDMGDGIIIGASSVSQLKQNMETIEKGHLPNEIVEAFNTAWSEARYESPEYFDFF